MTCIDEPCDDYECALAQLESALYRCLDPEPFSYPAHESAGYVDSHTRGAAGFGATWDWWEDGTVVSTTCWLADDLTAGGVQQDVARAVHPYAVAAVQALGNPAADPDEIRRLTAALAGAAEE